MSKRRAAVGTVGLEGFEDGGTGPRVARQARCVLLRVCFLGMNGRGGNPLAELPVVRRNRTPPRCLQHDLPRELRNFGARPQGGSDQTSRSWRAPRVGNRASGPGFSPLSRPPCVRDREWSSDNHHRHRKHTTLLGWWSVLHSRDVSSRSPRAAAPSKADRPRERSALERTLCSRTCTRTATSRKPGTSGDRPSARRSSTRTGTDP